MEQLRIDEFIGVGEAVDGEIVMEVVEVFEEAVAPGRTGFSAQGQRKCRGPGAFEVLF